MTNHSFTTSLPAGDLPVCVEFDYSAGRPAVMYLPNGDPGYPAEDAELDITSVAFVEVGKEYELIDDLSDSVLDYLREQASDYVTSYYDDEAA